MRIYKVCDVVHILEVSEQRLIDRFIARSTGRLVTDPASCDTSRTTSQYNTWARSSASHCFSSVIIRLAPTDSDARTAKSARRGNTRRACVFPLSARHLPLPQYGIRPRAPRCRPRVSFQAADHS